MENKRSLGVTLFGIYFIFSALFGFIGSYLTIKIYHWIAYYNFIIFIVLLFLAINILQLKEWSRKGIIIYQIFTLLAGVFVIIPASSELLSHTRMAKSGPFNYQSVIVIVGTLIIIYFFTRPKVKEQFK